MNRFAPLPILLNDDLDAANGGLLVSNLPVALGGSGQTGVTSAYANLDFGGYAPAVYPAYSTAYLDADYDVYPQPAYYPAPAYGPAYGQPYVIETIYEEPAYAPVNNNPAGALINAFSGIVGAFANATRR